jgi:hypothetical protein
MRGQRIFNEIVAEGGISKTLHKGRNNSLVHKRNECLAARYYYYAIMKHKCYEDVLRQLMTEFYLSPITVAHIIQCNTDDIHELKLKKPTLYYFKNRWPHLKW